MSTFAEAVRRCARTLEQAGWPPADAARDAEVLARSVLGWDAGAWLARTRNFNGSDGCLLGIKEFKSSQFQIAHLNGVMKIQCGNIHIDMVRHVLRKSVDFQGSSFANEGSTFSHTGRLSNQTGRDVHLHFSVV